MLVVSASFPIIFFDHREFSYSFFFLSLFDFFLTLLFTLPRYVTLTTKRPSISITFLIHLKRDMDYSVLGLLFGQERRGNAGLAAMGIG